MAAAPGGLPDRRLVHHILVSEFDIDKGSGLAHQYPTPTGASESLLAELMLPDGVHNREEDWTIFFLNQTAPEHDSAKGSKSMPSDNKTPAVTSLDAFVYEFTEATQGWSQLGTDTMKVYLERNALRIAGPDFSKSLPRDVELQHQSMEPLFHCVIVGEAAFGFRFADQVAELTFETHCEELRKETPSEVFEPPSPAPAPVVVPSTEKSSDKPFLYVLNVIRNKRVENVRRGAVVKALAICTPYRWLHVFKPVLLLAVDRYFKTSDVSVLAELYDAINAMDVSGMPDLTQAQKLMLRSGGDKEKQIFTTSIPYMKINIPVRIPMTTLDDEVADGSVSKLVTTFAPGFMTLYNALLLEKRVIFVGYNRSASEVVNLVLAACQLICPPISGLIKRCFPYTNLSNMTFLEFRNYGYLVGVTNPIFRDNTEWWDVLCNLETGKVIHNPKFLPPPETERHAASDAEFLADVLAKIEGHVAEESIRQLFTDYTQRIMDLALNDAEFPDEIAKKKELEINHARGEQWKKTAFFQQYAQERHERRSRRTITAIDTERHIQKLRVRKALSAQEIYSIFKDFNTCITTDVQILELLTYLPENQGGLYPIAVSLVHPSENVRRATAELFHRISRIEAGRELINNLNDFLRTAYERSKALLR
ncbi:hypothetical protein CAOG_01378 [Capsaspora owczarzaki ATCC 30864]|uniref:hypothetical protein n=1 Tax=Capsaspora owczarzaki (strain ATCC 30864) TaxID=595528 RepID=UPI0001FE2E08|nr:hypothetical protein CAOG_01378 [Capsaspora owczarzaki ATCC 30864]|eukprot:XP_004349898.1 hypothetical protein CAOG_01378 [Capsaspora owczarzaki ATCC 30864]